MIDNYRINIAVICQTIERNGQLRINRLQAGLSDCRIKSRSKRINARLHKAVGAADSNSVGAAHGDAIDAVNCDRVRGNRKADAIHPRGDDPVGAVNRYGAVSATNRDPVGMVYRASIRAAGRDSVCARGNNIVGAAYRDAGRVPNN